MLILHIHPLSSYCWKVMIALREMGVPFETRMVDLSDAEQRTAFAALWPTAKIPLLQDGDRIIPETSIQIEYADRLHRGANPMLPRDPDARLEARLWDRLFDLYVMSPTQRFVAQRILPADRFDPHVPRECRAALAQAYDMTEARLAGRTWAAGDDFSIADCAAAPALFYAGIVQPFADRHRWLSRYFDRLMDRPTVRESVEAAEPWLRHFPLADELLTREA